MSLRNLLFSAREVDDLAVRWMNLLSARQIDEFFWDYTGPFGYSSSGYGLGAVTAARIVARRPALPGGYTAIGQIRAIRGIGADKIDDMRVQAKEALALAAYQQLTPDPKTLWERLLSEGPGLSLSRFVGRLRRRLRLSEQLRRAGGYLVRIPFVALARVESADGDQPPEPRQFLRVRFQPWAFAVHPKETWWQLLVESAQPGRHQVRLERLD